MQTSLPTPASAGLEPVSSTPSARAPSASGEEDRIPLACAQQRLWFLEQLNPRSPLYNVPLALRWRGPLDPERLRAALNAVLARHEALRTNFRCAQGTPYQVVRPVRPLPFTFVDVAPPDPSTAPETLDALLRDQALRPFDLEKDLLIRASLFRVHTDEHVLLIVLHHLVCDEWSLEILTRELADAYSGAVRTREDATELPIQYADYAVWQRESIEGGALTQQLEYWKKKLADHAATLSLPADRRLAGTPSHRGARYQTELSPSLTRAIRDLSRREGATVLATLLTAFKTLLVRYTGQEQVTVGSPIAGRSRVETEGLIGFFVNMLVLRTDLAGNPTFREALARVRTTTFEAYANADIPFDLLVERIHPERSESQTPFFRVVFALEHPGAPPLIPGLELEAVDVNTGTAKFDLTWVVRDHGARLEICVEYAVDVFREATVAGMVRHWIRLLEEAVSHPERTLSELPILEETERRLVLEEWNRTAPPLPAESLCELFDRQVTSRPSATAVCFGSDSLSYAELSRRANQIAGALRTLGAGRDALVALYAERGSQFIAGVLGIVKAGAAYVPLDPTYPAERIEYILRDTGAPIVLAEERLVPSLPPHNARVLTLESLGGSPSETIVSRSAPDELAYVIYTSGSTGRPKGVMIPQAGIARLVCAPNYIHLGPEDRIAQASNTSFDAATFEIWGALLNGAMLVGVPREVSLSPKELAAHLAQNRITVLFLTTALFNQVARTNPRAFSGLRYLLFGGEACDPQCVREVVKNAPCTKVLHVYGPTETTTFASWYHVESVADDATTIPIGRPVSSTRLYVLDRALQPVPPGVPGELYIGGTGLALGYLNDPDLTAARFLPDPFTTQTGARLYRTGDQVRYREDGNIEFLGRLDQQVKIRGFRVEPGEIEAVLLSHPDVTDAIVVTTDAAEEGRRLVGYIAGRATLSVAAIREFLKSKLPAYMVPARLTVVPKMPLNANGKIDRRRLPTPDETPDPSSNFVAPRNAVETKLALIWSEVLGRERIGVNDDFFDLGGHSLLAVRLFAQIEETFGRTLPLASLFRRPTIEKFAELLAEPSAAQDWRLLVEIQPAGTKPPIYWIHSLGGDGGGAFFYYRKLAELLGSDQPSYGIRSPQEPFTNVVEMASRYVDELTRAQPEGPYFLGGFCFGGIVAYQMAVELSRRGRKVGLLVLLESAPPGPAARNSWWRSAQLGMLAGNVQVRLGEVWREGPKATLSRGLRKLKAAWHRLQHRFHRETKAAPAAELGDLIDMEHYPKDYVRYAEAHWAALRRYEPEDYSGGLTLFRARKQPLLSVDPTLGWGSLAQGGVDVKIMPGTHDSMMVEPHVHILATELKACLSKAQSIPGSGAPARLSEASRAAAVQRDAPAGSVV